jgi:hypothetical protein
MIGLVLPTVRQNDTFYRFSSEVLNAFPHGCVHDDAWMQRLTPFPIPPPRLVVHLPPQMKLRDRHEALARRKLLGAKAIAAGAKSGTAGGGAVGCLLARGEGLEIISINAYGKQLLACSADPDPAPRFVRDLLDPGFAPTHARVMAKAVRDRSLPKSIQHPLRSVGVRRADGTTVQCELLVGKLDESQASSASSPCC